MSSMPVSDSTLQVQGADRLSGRPESLEPSEPYKAYLRLQKRKRRFIRFSQLFVLIAFLGLWQLAAELKWIDSMLTSKPTALLTSFQEPLSIMMIVTISEIAIAIP